LVVAEVALASVLVIGALLLTRSMSRLLAVDLGFNDQGLMTASLQTAGSAFQSDSAVWAYYQRVHEAIVQQPGVQAAGLVSQLPFGGGYDYYGVRSESRIRVNPDDAVSAARFAVTPGYLETMGIRLIEGRTFTAADRAGSPPVVIVNQQYAASQFPGRSALGERIGIGGSPDGGLPMWRTIVGVVGSVKQQGLDEPDGPQVYHPHDQWLFGDDLALVVRADGDPAALIQRTVRSLHPDPTIEQVIPMSAVVSQKLGPRRLVLGLFLGFAALALLLAAVGIYGVMASGVAEQTRELGIRAALGASSASLRRGVLRESVGLGLVGLVGGLAAGGALGRLLGANLFGFAAFDPLSYGATAAALLGTVVLSAWVPAARAARHDPAMTLRAE
jgi:predicted permease